jgi:putative ABC transport system permease protein
VAADVRGYDLERDEPRWMQGTVYVPHNVRATVENGRLPSAMSLVLETPPGGWDGGASIRRSVARVTADVAVSEIRPLGASLSDARAVPASTAAFFGAFAGVALVLGLIGIYGVLSFLVSNRTREIGIRIALGAPRRRVLALVMGEGAKLALIGIAVGSAAAVALGRLLATELHGVSPLDPVTYAAVALMMAIVTLLACGVPTRRAMRVDPLIALREER